VSWWNLVPKKPDPKPEEKKPKAAAAPPKTTPKLSTPASYGIQGNPHDQFVQDLIAGLSDGSIVLRSVDVRRTSTHPHIEMLVELLQLDMNAKTLPGKLHRGAITGATAPAGGVIGATGPAPAIVIPQYYSSSAVSMTSVTTPNMIQAVQNLPGAKSYGPEGRGMKISSGTEPLVGYRDFTLTEGLYGLALRSRNGAVWPPRKRMRALCGGNPFADHDVPDPHCQCGIYAYDKPDNSSLKRDNSSLWGEIAMWGEVLVCDTGYRAEFAYPTALFMRKPGGPSNRVTRTLEYVRQELEDSYGIPVIILAERASKTASQLMEEALNEMLKEKA
jgi:hypothetical protein